MEQILKLTCALIFPNGSGIKFLKYTLQFSAARASSSMLSFQNQLSNLTNEVSVVGSSIFHLEASGTASFLTQIK